MEKCCICLTDNAQIGDLDFNRDQRLINCAVCGKYIVDDMLLSDSPIGIPDADRHILSAVVRESFDAGCEPLIVTYQSFHELIKGRALRLSEKKRRLMKWLDSKTEYFGHRIKVDINLDYPVAFCKNDKEFRQLILLLKENGLIEEVSNDGYMRLSGSAFEYLENTFANEPVGKKAFVAMWFDDSLRPIYENAIEPAIIACGYQSVRVDFIEHNRKIDDIIIGLINESKFLVADFTNQRQSVYFEAGYALGQGKEVIWLCRSSDIKECHFDTRQYNHIVWENENELREKLENRIAAVIGKYSPN